MTVACRSAKCGHYLQPNKRTLRQYQQEGLIDPATGEIAWQGTPYTTVVDERWREHLLSRHEGDWVDGWWCYRNRPGWVVRLRWEPVT